MKCAKKKSDRPLWILVWGGLDDVAQALHDAPEIEKKIRVYWIGGPNKKWGVNSYTYIAESFPNLWMIENNASYRGFIGGEEVNNKLEYIEDYRSFGRGKEPNNKLNESYYECSIKGAGNLGKDFKSYYDGNIKMGDTPSLLYMMNGNPDDPEGESWGGSFEPIFESPRSIFNRNSTLKDTVAVYSVVEFHFKGPKSDKAIGTPCFTFRIDNQDWTGVYLGNGVYGIKYAPKAPAVLHYKITSNIKELNGMKGAFVVSELWPGNTTKNGYKLGKNWFTDKRDVHLFEGKWQGSRTVLRWRKDVLTDWAERWNWLKHKMYTQMADSEMKRFPEAWQIDWAKRPAFGYCQGVVTLAMLKVWKQTNDDKYYKYVEKYADMMVDDDGKILNYDYINGRHNIDMINAGKILFDVYEQTGNPKYKKAMDMLYNAMMKHPRNSLGGFWHKEVYPWQMWLDGLYMGSPYLAQYAVVNDKPELLNDVIMQFMIVEKFMHDPVTGLYFHAWDEKKVQRWCDSQTGLSHHFWGRSIGWWFMALVDVLDFVPENHPLRGNLLAIAKGLAESLPRFQHDGLWYQIVNLENREGNYQEATATAMFMYSIAKAVNRGYIDRKYMEIATDAYDGIVNKLIRIDADGTVNITNCCAVAGLGGNPYRDGSFEYYVNEPVRENDPKATGPFIMGCIELSK